MPGRPDRYASPLARALLFASALWAVAIVVTPWIARTAPRRSPSLLAVAATYRAGAIVCHQRPERSFHAGGLQWPVCARCAGLYGGAGMTAGILLLAAHRLPVGGASGRIRRVQVMAWAAAPTAITWLAERAGMWSPGNIARAALAAPLGVAVCWLVALAWRTAGDGAEPGVN